MLERHTAGSRFEGNKPVAVQRAMNDLAVVLAERIELLASHMPSVPA